MILVIIKENNPIFHRLHELEKGDTEEVVMKSGLIEQLLKIEQKYSDKVAILSDEGNITYGELYDIARRYARYFFEKNYRNVCVIEKRSIRLYTVVLGVVLSGGSYTLFENEDVNENVINKINRINPDVILSGQTFEGVKTTDFVGAEALFAYQSTEVATRREQEDCLYYVCTSGTTGEGKIISVSDRNILCYLNGYIKELGLNDQDVFFQQSPIYYDGFAEELLSTLLLGGSMVFTDSVNLKSVNKLIEQVNAHKVTVWPSTPLVIGEVNRLRKSIGAKKIVCSGDVLRSSQIDWLINYVDVYNMYGLTETTVCATCHLCTKDEEGEISVGHPLKGYSICICNEEMQKVGTGEIGEILIGGGGVAKCLDESAAYVVLDDMQTYYRTGDLGRWDSSGAISFLGRNDRVIKNNGNRVALGEIENCVMRFDGISEAVAVFEKEKQQIYLFYVGDRKEQIYLQEVFKKQLPSYMRPNRYVHIDEMPLSATGKIDYVRLKSYGEEMTTEVFDDEVVDDEVAKIVIDKVTELCGNIGDYRTQTFEEIGMNSFLFMMLLVDLEEHFGVEMDDEMLMIEEDTTIEELVKLIKEIIGE